MFVCYEVNYARLAHSAQNNYWPDEGNDKTKSSPKTSQWRWLDIEAILFSCFDAANTQATHAETRLSDVIKNSNLLCGTN